MAIRRILNVQDDLAHLRRKSRVVEQINTHILTLLEDLKDTLYDVKGYGLAAPQVGALRRIAVVDVSEDGSELNELINPVIFECEGVQSAVEGCLSFSDLNGTVERPSSIKVQFMNREGETVCMEADGILARAIGHEVDHLDGILFVDAATDLHRPSEREEEKK